MAALNHLPQAERLLSGVITNAGINAVVTSFTISNPPTKLPTYLEFEPDDATNFEVMRIVGVSGSTVTVERGVYNAGVGKAHLINKPYKQKIFAKHWDAIFAAIESGYITEDPASTLVRVDATTLDIRPTSGIAGGDLTAYYTQGRLLRFNGSDSLTAVVGSSSYDGVNNKTVVLLAVGTVPTTPTSVEFAIQPRGATNKYPTTAEVQLGASQYGVDAGSSDLYAITLSPALTSYQQGTRLIFKANTDNTGPCSLNVNGLGAKALKIFKDQDPPDGYIKAGSLVLVDYDGTNFQILSVNSYPGVGATVITPVPVANVITLDCALSNEFSYQVPANTTIALTNVKVGQKIFIDLQQVGSGGPFTITWPSGAVTINWDQGFVPVLSTGLSKRDSFCLRCIAVNNFRGHIIGQNA